MLGSGRLNQQEGDEIRNRSETNSGPFEVYRLAYHTRFRYGGEIVELRQEEKLTRMPKRSEITRKQSPNEIDDNGRALLRGIQSCFGSLSKL
jgi:hypothetical protein